MKRAVFTPPAVSVTLDGLVEKVGGCWAVVLNAIERAIFPANPFRLDRVSVEFPV